MTTKKTKPAIPQEKLELYEKLLAGFPDVELKGTTMPYTAHNGNMFSFLNAEGELALRLPEEERQKFLTKFKTKLFESHGTVLKEYVHVPASLFSKTNDMRKYMVMSYAYIKTLKAKKK